MTEPIVQTILGDVRPDALGRTLTHEHLSMVFTHFHRTPPEHLDKFFTDGISLDNVGYIRQFPYSSEYNLIFNDTDAVEAVRKDLAEYKRCGGGTIVENSTMGLNKDISVIHDMSKETGVNVVLGTGYYIANTQLDETKALTNEQMYEHMLKEMTEGCENYAEVKAGFLGEIASDWPIKDFERKAIQAAGELQAQLGCGVSFHPHRHSDAPFEIIRLYLEAGGKADKAIMSHLDRTIQDETKLLRFASLGTYCQYDLFGVEVSQYQLNLETDMPSDAQRLDKIKFLVEEGYLEKVLMSHDIHTKHRLTSFGGHGYSHIINTVIPKMKIKGFTRKEIDQITIKNPATCLSMLKNYENTKENSEVKNIE